MTSEELAARAAEARKKLEEAAAAGDARAAEILAELDGTATRIRVDPRPPPPKPWNETDREEP